MENININTIFDIESLVEYLKSKPEHKNVALQFDDNLSVKAVEISEKLKLMLPGRFIFIVGESCYGQCCADEIAALHLNANIIIRIGDSCLTRNKQLPVYFLFENKHIAEEIIKEKLEKFEDKNILVIYNHNYTKSFQSFKTFNENTKISKLAYSPEIYNEYNPDEDFIIFSRIIKNLKEIKKSDIILYFGEEEDKILTELCLRYVNHNQIYFFNSQNNFSMVQISSQFVNKVYYKRFNLIEKAKVSEVFGIIIGSLSIKGLNDVIEEVKNCLKLKNRKFYTFLLGKITLEKLSNFVQYIDCFVLIACPFSDFYDFKTLMKPLVSPLDISLAFNDEKFKWDMTYTFDPNFITQRGLTQIENENSNENKIENNLDTVDSKFSQIKLKESEKNQALANIFSFKTLENYDKLHFKGLDVNETKGIVEKFKLGRIGIPIKYEDITE